MNEKHKWLEIEKQKNQRRGNRSKSTGNFIRSKNT